MEIRTDNVSRKDCRVRSCKKPIPRGDRRWIDKHGNHICLDCGYGMSHKPSDKNKIIKTSIKYIKNKLIKHLTVARNCINISFKS